MGIRFDLVSANWIAHLLQPDVTVPDMGDSFKEQETLRIFLEKLRGSYYSSRDQELRFRGIVERAGRMLLEYPRPRLAHHVLRDLRFFLGKRPWTALIVPSGHNRKLDRFLCDEAFLRYIVSIRPNDPGLILQLEDAPENSFSVLDVFPAFKSALTESNDWPGVLLWTPGGDSVFLPIGEGRREDIERRVHWIFSHLGTTLGVDLELLRTQYLKEYPEVRSKKSTIHFLQLSDLHIGSKEAGTRVPRVQQLVRNIVEDLRPSGTVVPIITGDLLDTLKNEYVDNVRAFVDFLAGVGDEDPLIILGNHDVRKGGIVGESFAKAMRFPLSPRVVWYDAHDIGMICLNSVMGGKLARGLVGEQQLLDLGNDIDRKKNSNGYSLLAALHHHPIPVDVPDWYSRPFYERILGGEFERTDALVDSDAVMRFIKGRSISAVLHGHKHIPRAEMCDSTAIVGCGSTVGKVSTTDGGTYMSVNVVSVNGATGRLSARLLAERIPGGGLREEKRHEFILRSFR